MIKTAYEGGPPRLFEEQGKKAIYFRGTREQKYKTEGNRATKAILGNRAQKIKIFIMGNKGKCLFMFQGNKGTGSLWEGLIKPRSLLH